MPIRSFCPRPLSLSSFLPFLFLLSGCVSAVKVTHRVPPDRLGPEGLRQIARVHILVKTSPSVDPDSGALAQAVGFLSSLVSEKDAAIQRPLRPAELESLMRKTARLFARRPPASAWT